MVAEPLTPESFAPFGTVLRRPDAPAEATGPGWSWWANTGEPAAGRYAVGYLALERPLAAAVLLLEGTGTEDTVVARFNPIPLEV